MHTSHAWQVNVCHIHTHFADLLSYQGVLGVHLLCLLGCQKLLGWLEMAGKDHRNSLALAGL
jgi:hypothetical protein